MLVYSFIVVNNNKIYCNLKDIDMSISPIEKFIILTEDVALPTKIFMGKKANLIKFIWLVFKCFCSRSKNEKKFRSVCGHLFYLADLCGSKFTITTCKSIIFLSAKSSLITAEPIHHQRYDKPICLNSYIANTNEKFDGSSRI